MNPKDRREALGLSVKQLASEAGVGQTTVRTLESGGYADPTTSKAPAAVLATLDRLEVAARGEKPASAGNYVKAVCECDPAKVIRLGRANLESGVSCNVCGATFVLAHDPSTGPIRGEV